MFVGRVARDEAGAGRLDVQPVPRRHERVRAPGGDYQRRMFPQHDVWFLHSRSGSGRRLRCFRRTRPSRRTSTSTTSQHDFEFVLFIGFKDNDFTRRLATVVPSFCLTDTFPTPTCPGIVPRDPVAPGRRRPSRPPSRRRLLRRRVFSCTDGEDIVLSVGPHPSGQEPARAGRGYREQVYEPFGLPLILVGGADDVGYHRARRAVRRRRERFSSIPVRPPQMPVGGRRADRRPLQPRPPVRLGVAAGDASAWR